MPNTTDVQHWEGQHLLGQDGSKIGKIDAIYLDDHSGEPEWALVNTGLFGTRSSFVPIAQASSNGDGVTVPFDKDKVKGAPNVDEDGHLSPQEEAELYRYYGRDDYDRAGGTAGTTGTADHDRAADRGDAHGTVGHDTSGTNTDDAMTRSEEELRVGTRERETGKARLRKYVVTEQVTKTVPVSREEVRVEREPITDQNRDAATDGPAISEEEHEVTLHAEEPVVEKTAVPKERVRLDKDVVQDERTVTEEVRKERIDTDR
ncbi:PRC and DUF2382 domain-containing protein [Patulibacter americanus]|uniref:PRC and DUF2382 domain-containing protein n=1 Tax=Patulibacter americanus TaxID=588672 RepID=UPI00041C521A|nr:PRC and DUF2382 domain-containing protein [Patulibacter americanus]